MRRFRLLTLFLFSASLIGFAQGRSGSSAAGSSSSSSAGSSHASGGSSASASSSSSHSGGGSSASAHSTHGGSDSASGGSKAASSSRAPHATRDSRSRLTSENLKSKPQQTMPAKLNPQQPTTKPHHWLARLFHHRQPELAKAPKPCVGKNCPSPPPKPCLGKNCPPPPPPCGPGTVSNGHGGCVATNYAGNNVCATNPLTSGCPASLVQNQYSNCAALRAQLQQAMLELDRLQQAMNRSCAVNSQSTECLSLTQRYNAEQLQVETLHQHLMACRS